MPTSLNKLAAGLTALALAAGPAGAQVPAASSAASAPACRVAIDVGHTFQQPGATSARGVGEFFFNQRMARRLRASINARPGLAAFIVNEAGGPIGLSERTDQAQARQADLLISVHHDSLQPRYLSGWTHDGAARLYSDRFRGHSLFYSTLNPRADASLAVAGRIGARLLAAGFTPTLHHAEPIAGESRVLADAARGIYVFDDLVVLKTARMAAVLLECGVILNRDEELLLSDPAYQQRLATAVADAVEASCRSDLGTRPR